MERYTKKHVERATTYLADLAHELGLAHEPYWLQLASKQNGRPYRLLTEGQYPYLGLRDNGFLGWTAKEAYYTLRACASVLEACRAKQLDGGKL